MREEGANTNMGRRGRIKAYIRCLLMSLGKGYIDICCTMLSALLWVQKFPEKKRGGEEFYSTKLFAFSNQVGHPKCYIYIH